MTEQTKPRTSLSIRDRWISLVLAALVVALLWYLQAPREASIETGHLAEFLPITYLNQPTTDRWDEAAVHYENGSYNEAIPIYETLLTEEPDPNRARLFLGSCQLQTRRFDAAELTLRPLLSPGHLDSVETIARWLLAQLYLAMDQPAPAKDELRRLGRGSFLKEAAKEKRTALDAALADPS